MERQRNPGLYNLRRCGAKILRAAARIALALHPGYVGCTRGGAVILRAAARIALALHPGYG
jgi:hypothetical protein